MPVFHLFVSAFFFLIHTPPFLLPSQKTVLKGSLRIGKHEYKQATSFLKYVSLNQSTCSRIGIIHVQDGADELPLEHTPA